VVETPKSGQDEIAHCKPVIIIIGDRHVMFIERSSTFMIIDVHQRSSIIDLNFYQMTELAAVGARSVILSCQQVAETTVNKHAALSNGVSAATPGITATETNMRWVWTGLISPDCSSEAYKKHKLAPIFGGYPFLLLPHKHEFLQGLHQRYKSHFHP
jgi:hypothetical protein